MPAVKLLPDEKIEELQSLRVRGFTIREISRISGVPRATVHQYVRNTRVSGMGVVVGDNPVELPNLGVHLPYSVVCPVCGEEQHLVKFCLDCGAAWMGECGHGAEVENERHKGIDLKTIERGDGDDLLYFFSMEANDEE